MVKQKGNVLLLVCATVALLFVAALITYVGKGYFNGTNKNAVESNVFDTKEAKPGDKVGGMTIVSLKSLSANNGPITSKNVSVTFTGQVTLQGEYYQMGPNEMITERLGACFGNLDAASEKLMPKLAGETSRPGFCFSNNETADLDFSTGTGKATIIIDNYVLNRLPAEIWDTADLVKVVSKN